MKSAVSEDPSGHSRQRSVARYNVRPASFVHEDFSRNRDTVLNFADFSGPYKDYDPPGNRTPAVGEKIWGDTPYLPSYLDPMYPSKVESVGNKDNLYFRGPFYKGVSETHTEFVCRTAPPRREFHEFVRHYEEPGLKDEKSVTQSDFQPPFPMLPRDKAPCLKVDPSKTWYKSEPKEPKNPHAREHEMRLVQPEIVYIDEEPIREFNTEHNDNYICYQKDKTGTKIKDYIPVPKERFLENMREGHKNCSHSPVPDHVCDGACKLQQDCPGATPKRTTWLMHPKNYTFENGVMLIPCKCRNAEMHNL